MATIPNHIINNQVFVGCPSKHVRPRYARIVDDLKKKYPLSFVIVGRNDGQDAEDLLELIKSKLLPSSYAIFDATGGNANVSLEYGLAEANEIKRVIYLHTHAAANRGKADSAIISDLAGKRRNQYAQETRLHQLLEDFAEEHPYTKRFERFLRKTLRSKSKGKKKRGRALALKIIHRMDGQNEIRCVDIMDELRGEAYTKKETDQMIWRMHSEGLIQSKQGPYSKVVIA